MPSIGLRNPQPNLFSSADVADASAEERFVPLRSLHPHFYLSSSRGEEGDSSHFSKVFRKSGGEVLVWQNFGKFHSMEQWAASFKILLWLEVAHVHKPKPRLSVD